MYPIYDTTDKPETPTSPTGCFWYLVGFCLFALLVMGLAKWQG